MPVDEHGFQIHFKQISNGKIEVFSVGHSTGGDPVRQPVETITDMDEIDQNKVIDLVYKGLHNVLKTSFLFE